MNQILLTLGGLTLGGSAAVILLALLGRNPKSHYGARWRCWAWLLLCLRLRILLVLAVGSMTMAAAMLVFQNLAVNLCHTHIPAIVYRNTVVILCKLQISRILSNGQTVIMCF